MTIETLKFKCPLRRLIDRSWFTQLFSDVLVGQKYISTKQLRKKKKPLTSHHHLKLSPCSTPITYIMQKCKQPPTTPLPFSGASHASVSLSIAATCTAICHLEQCSKLFFIEFEKLTFSCVILCYLFSCNILSFCLKSRFVEKMYFQPYLERPKINCM